MIVTEKEENLQILGKAYGKKEKPTVKTKRTTNPLILPKQSNTPLLSDPLFVY